MSSEKKFWLWVVVLGVGMFVIVGIQGVLFYLTNSGELSEIAFPFRFRLVLFVVLALLTLLIFVGWGMRASYHRYVVPMHRITEDVEALVYGSHHARLPEDRNDPAGLAPLLNALMQRYQASEEAVHDRLESVLGALSEEKSRLEALLDGLSEGVVEFSVEGRVVRFNQAARRLFANQVELVMGLPVEEMIEPAMVTFANEALQEQLSKGVPHPFTSFICRNVGNGLLRARVAPLLVYGGRLAGYVLTVEPETTDVPAAQETESIPPDPAGKPFPEARRSTRGNRDAQNLAGLRYVVLDTETTGLDPGEGDEVISLGAVAVYRGHLVQGEVFDRLIDPGRAVKPSAQRVHGLSDDDLRGCPTLADVLPDFFNFARGAVLVAHNAAFDFAFLRPAAHRLGLKMDQPVLDTMLISAVLHPHQTSHSLDALLARYGLPVTDRHTALGDARMTAELLLRLLPQLEERGLVTLEAVLAACRRTPLARLSYG